MRASFRNAKCIREGGIVRLKPMWLRTFAAQRAIAERADFRMKKMRSLAEKDATRSNPMKLPDLAPTKDAQAGGVGLHSDEPPLLIPPPGFVATNENGSGDIGR